jgi:hypothetical protein
LRPTKPLCAFFKARNWFAISGRALRRPFSMTAPRKFLAASGSLDLATHLEHAEHLVGAHIGIAGQLQELRIGRDGGQLVEPNRRAGHIVRRGLVQGFCVRTGNGC